MHSSPDHARRHSGSSRSDVDAAPIDAIPNIGENQVIIFTSWPGRSPKDIEDQITYPLSVAMLAVPEAESVRGKSLFGYSFVQVTFKDHTDFYWARSRVSEQLGTAAAALPEGVTPTSDPMRPVSADRLHLNPLKTPTGNFEARTLWRNMNCKPFLASVKSPA